MSAFCACERSGCPHHHLEGPRRHGWCCNACRMGEEFHTINCSGKGERVIALPVRPLCIRKGCLHAHVAGPRRHGYCCNACKNGDPFHTHNCTGYVQQAEPPARGLGNTITTSNRETEAAVRLPPAWVVNTWSQADVMTHLKWYALRFGLDWESGALEAWEALALETRCCGRNRPLRLLAYAQDSAPQRLMQINVAERGLTAVCDRLHDMRDVTGLDFSVQAMLVMQKETAIILLDACRLIEMHGLAEFCFACHGGTHRSVGCCVLLAALVYQNADIILTTLRTRQAAQKRGLTNV